MDKRKSRMALDILAVAAILAVLGGCGKAEPVDGDAGRAESMESGGQGTGLPATEGTADGGATEDGEAPTQDAPEMRTERVDNPDGGWTVSEYDEMGDEIRRSTYDADGNQMQAIGYNADGSIHDITEYGQDRYVTYFYKDNAISRSMEYDASGILNSTTVYTYNPDGTLGSTNETSKRPGGEDKKVEYYYDADGDLSSTWEFVANKEERHTTYKKDGSVAYYDADYESWGTKYKTYRADGALCSETESDSAGRMVRYTYYFYEGHDTDNEVAGYAVNEYDDAGNVADTSYYGIGPTSELMNPALGQQKETEHFIFYCTDQDVEILEVLAETFEGSYDRITSDLGKEPPEKIKVYISPNLMVHHNAIGRPDDPDWAAGEGRDMCLYMVSPLNPGPAHTYGDMFPIAVHEFTHVVARLFNRRQPSYLSEGIACYEAGQGEGSWYYVQQDKGAGTLPFLEEMDGWKSFVNMSGYDAGRAYAYGGIFVDFVVEEFGFDAVVSLLEGKPQTEAFGMGMEEANEKWMEYLESY